MPKQIVMLKEDEGWFTTDCLSTEHTKQLLATQDGTAYIQRTIILELVDLVLNINPKAGELGEGMANNLIKLAKEITDV